VKADRRRVLDLGLAEAAGFHGRFFSPLMRAFLAD